MTYTIALRLHGLLFPGLGNTVRCLTGGSLVEAAHNDTDLIRAVAGGDREALGELYDRHASAVLAIGFRFELPEETAEDVLQDVFLEVWSHASDFDPDRGTVITWLAVRMRSRCLDLVRKRKRRRELLDESGELLEPTPLENPGIHTIEHERLRDAVANLDDDLRVVTELAYFGGSSTVVIAKQLDIPRGTVKSRMRRAREALRTVLDEEAP